MTLGIVNTVATALGLKAALVWGGVALAAAGSAWGFVAWREHVAYAEGYGAAEALWKGQIDQLVASYRAAEAAERTRQAEENRRVREEFEARVAGIMQMRDDLRAELGRMADEAEKDRDRDRACLGADSVRRLNRIRPTVPAPDP
jgi:hypothetical protein